MANGDRQQAGNSSWELDEKSQGFVEYTVIVVFVVLFFWLAVASTHLNTMLAARWSIVVNCVRDPAGCSAPPRNNPGGLKAMGGTAAQQSHSKPPGEP